MISPLPLRGPLPPETRLGRVTLDAGLSGNGGSCFGKPGRSAFIGLSREAGKAQVVSVTGDYVLNYVTILAD